MYVIVASYVVISLVVISILTKELDKSDTENVNLRAEVFRLQQELDRQSKNT